MTSNAAVAHASTRRAQSPAPFAIYAVTVLLSAFLLFQVQLVIGKYILPWFGGMPAVWNTCMLAFQLLLLGGYCYAHVISTRVSARTAARIHQAVLLASVVVLAAGAVAWGVPLTPGGSWKPAWDANPVVRILQVLGVSVGVPFFVLSTTSSLVQRWYAQTNGAAAYRLYAISNIGSFLGLVTYPFLFERVLGVRQQAWLWTGLYIAFAAACAWLARTAPTETQVENSTTRDAEPQATLSRKLLWVLLPACASALLLATTNMICQEVAVIPLLWVLPLALYLLTFVLAFENPRWYRRGFWHPLLLISTGFAVVVLTLGASAATVPALIIYSAMMFSACMVLHGEASRLKPGASGLTLFYLCVSAGGALGGIFVVLIAPVIFTNYYELQISLIASGALAIAAVWHDRESWLRKAPAYFTPLILAIVLLLLNVATLRTYKMLFFRSETLYGAVLLVLAVVMGILVLRRSLRAPLGALIASSLAVATFGAVLWLDRNVDVGQTLDRSRNFFGVKTVVAGENAVWLKHGKIWHGWQYADPARKMEPIGYYARNEGIGLVLGSPAQNRRVGIVGLGTGALSVYGRPGDLYRYYEIDPQVISLSTSERRWFSYLSLTPSDLEIVPGDARLAMEREVVDGKSQRYDVLVVDAFSSDAIPVHLITEEAIGLYVKQLRDENSVLCFHISNRTLDLEPVLAGAAERYGLKAVLVKAKDVRWVVMTRGGDPMKHPALAGNPGVKLLDSAPLHWTDDYSNLFEVVKRGSGKTLRNQ